MFESISTIGLQHYWWILISILGASFVFLTFVQGGQTLIAQLSKNKKEQNLLINAIGRRWD
ncbi:MAG TPA: cytochrome C oxidase assembly protein, partial [Bacteroidales bacterium]|nr:cytochrome C oxidase assembly protein [Bacteroidales bacterium]